jgi:uncharacterized membrane protein YkvA (DUF1232 family)
MAVRASSWFVRPGGVTGLFSDMRLAWRLLREPRVPFLVKMLPVLALFYVISPLDFIPDVLPVLGQIDDLGILILSLKLFLRLCPTVATTFHSGAIAARKDFAPMAPTDVVIDASYRRD